MPKSILITGAGGYLGTELLRALSAARDDFASIVATDVRPAATEQRLPGIEYLCLDVRDEGLVGHLRTHVIDTVVHLAAIVTPGRLETPELEYSVDVLGTRNVLEACIAAGVRHLIVTSSGAAYGYHADNPAWLHEDDPLRGNDEFPYSRHKRLVEEMLADYRVRHPELRQLIFRPGAILGDRVSNQITALFEKPVLVGARGTSTPFAFIWDQDVVACLLAGIREERTGIFNLAADSVMTLDDIAQRTAKRCVQLPPGLLRLALAVLHPLGLSRYGPEQVDFIRYRPVLSNERLKRDFGYTPQLSSIEVFERYWRHRSTAADSREPMAGKVVLITGAASGIGLALAHRFGAAGARLALADVDAVALERGRTQLAGLGIEAIASNCDVTSPADCQATVAAVNAQFGAIDVVVNNAGITHLGTFAETDDAVLRRVMEVNFFGAANCTRAALATLRRSRGAIVVISSIAGFTPLAGRAGYAASKHALHGLFNSLRGELRGSGVDVVLICPGFTATNIGKHALGADGSPAAVQRTTTGREASPEQVADAVYRATVRRRRQTVLSPVGKLACAMWHWMPALYERLMLRALT